MKHIHEIEYIKRKDKLLDKYDSGGKYVYEAIQRMIIEKDLKSHKFTDKR